MEDLLGAMDKRDEWHKRVKEIHARGMYDDDEDISEVVNFSSECFLFIFLVFDGIFSSRNHKIQIFLI